MNKILIAPSILSADFARLGEEIHEVEAAGADWIHVDVMDGHFVPNLTIGAPVVSRLKPITKLPLDCHLMVENPDRWIEAFAKAGASMITIHIEASSGIERDLKTIRSYGCKPGVTLNPGTDVEKIESVLPFVDLVLVMSVQPGFGGQKFMENSVDKIRTLAAWRKEQGLKFLIEVDGGVGVGNIKKLRDAGCDVFVAGSAIFAEKNRKFAITELRREAGGAL